MSKVTYGVDIIDMLSYNNGYAAGYAEGMDAAYEIGYCDGIHISLKEKNKKLAEKRTLRVQRIYGSLILGCTAIATAVLMDVTFACIGVPLGLWLLLSKKKIIA